MKPEEHLDRLIESREQGLEPLPVAGYEMAAGLAAAQALARLNELDVPPDFARRLERSIRLRTRELAYESDGSLRAIRPLPVSIPRSPHPARPRARRTWIAALGVAAVLVLAWVGLLTVSAQSLPGDPLYGLKQATQQFRLNLSGSQQDRISAQIEQIHSALADLNAVVVSGRGDDAIKVALNTLADETNSAQSAVAALPAGTGRDTAQRNLDSALGEEDQALRHLLNQVDWPTRLALTRQLGALGDAVPTVTHVSTLAQANGTLLITLTGTHFAPGVRLVFDGQPAGTVTGSTPGQLSAVLGSTTALSGEHEIGVLNPDGTAAQVAYEKDTRDDGPGDDHSRHGTPQPTSGPGDDSGD